MNPRLGGRHFDGASREFHCVLECRSLLRQCPERVGAGFKPFQTRPRSAASRNSRSAVCCRRKRRIGSPMHRVVPARHAVQPLRVITVRALQRCAGSARERSRSLRARAVGVRRYVRALQADAGVARGCSQRLHLPRERRERSHPAAAFGNSRCEGRVRFVASVCSRAERWGAVAAPPRSALER